MKKKSLNIFICIFALLLGVLGGAFGYTYATIPNTETLTVSQDVYYSYNNDTVTTSKLTGEAGELSVHFLELGNKYTGDCTFIKYGDIDILIDCGSKASSIPTITNYLNKYVTDGILEYVIITHAHLDHYAGFATNSKVNGIFDLYQCNNIIDFGTATHQTGNTYQNYVKKRTKEIEAGATYFDASTITAGNNKEFVVDANLKFEVLYNYYYDHQSETKTENNFSVCTLFTHNDKHFLFTGDLEEKGEEQLVLSNNLPKVDLFKAGHHGSGTSSTEPLLNAIEPKIVCICCCAGSSEYTSNPLKQFPTQEFIERVSKHTIYVYVTTLCVNYENSEFTSMNGNIVAISRLNAATLSMDFSNNSTPLKDTEWFKANRTAPAAWK